MEQVNWIDEHLTFANISVVEVAQGMMHSQYFSIIGPPFTGKSQFLMRVKNYLATIKRFHTVYFDMFNLLDLSRDEFYSTLLLGIKSSLGLGEITNTEREDLYDSLTFICSRVPHRLFIFLANIDHLDDQLARNVLLSFRAISESSKHRRQNVVVAVSGSKNLLEWTINRTSPFNIARRYTLSPMDLSEISSYVGQVEASYSLLLKATEDGLIYLSEMTLGNPFLVSRIVRLIVESNCQVSRDTIDNAIDQLLTKNSALDIYLNRLKYAIEVDQEAYFLILHLMKFVDEEKFDYEHAELSGIALRKHNLFIFSNPIVESFIRTYYDAVRLSHIAINYGMWSEAIMLLKSLTRSTRISLTHVVMRDLPDSMIDVIRSFSAMLIAHRDIFAIEQMFRDGMELLINVKRFIIFRVDNNDSMLIPYLHYGFDTIGPEVVNIDVMNNAISCCSYYRRELSVSTNCNYFACPMGAPQGKPSMILYCSMNFPSAISRQLRLRIISKLSHLGKLMYMAISNAKYLGHIKKTLHSVATNSDMTVKNKNQVLSTIMSMLRKRADRDKKLYFILTAMTMRFALEFNRAALFLINNQTFSFKGEMAVGSPDADEHSRLSVDPFFNVPQRAIEDLWAEFDTNKSKFLDNHFSQIIRNIDIRDSALLRRFRDQKMLFTIIDEDTIRENIADPFIDQLFSSGIMDNKVIVFPLITGDSFAGIICVDNRWNQGRFELINLLIAHFFAAQAGLLIREEEVIQKEIDFANMAREFIKYASHELKTPVQTILSITELLKNRNCLPTDLIYLESEAERIRFAVTGVLDFMSTTEGYSMCSGSERRGVIEMTKLIEFIHLCIHRPAVSRNIAPPVCNNFPYKRLVLSQDCLKILLRNILHNARTHCEDSSNIHVTISESNDKVVFLIEDNGPGITADLLAYHLLQDDQKPASHDDSRPHIGLRICQHIITEMNGVLSIGNIPNKYGGRCGLWVEAAIPYDLPEEVK